MLIPKLTLPDQPTSQEMQSRAGQSMPTGNSGGMICRLMGSEFM